jgi:hypothetical protein
MIERCDDKHTMHLAQKREQIRFSEKEKIERVERDV